MPSFLLPTTLLWYRLLSNKANSQASSPSTNTLWRGVWALSSNEHVMWLETSKKRAKLLQSSKRLQKRACRKRKALKCFHATPSIKRLSMTCSGRLMCSEVYPRNLTYPMKTVATCLSRRLSTQSSLLRKKSAMGSSPPTSNLLNCTMPSLNHYNVLVVFSRCARFSPRIMEVSKAYQLTASL